MSNVSTGLSAWWTEDRTAIVEQVLVLQSLHNLAGALPKPAKRLLDNVVGEISGPRGDPEIQSVAAGEGETASRDKRSSFQGLM